MPFLSHSLNELSPFPLKICNDRLVYVRFDPILAPCSMAVPILVHHAINHVSCLFYNRWQVCCCHIWLPCCVTPREFELFLMRIFSGKAVDGPIFIVRSGCILLQLSLFIASGAGDSNDDPGAVPLLLVSCYVSIILRMTPALWLAKNSNYPIKTGVSSDENLKSLVVVILYLGIRGFLSSWILSLSAI